MSFTATGELSRFDPSRFAKVTPARINASFKSEGKLAPHPLLSASFELKDSQLASQPLSGRGRLSIDWPRIPQADIELLAGTNRLHASGAFGQPGDRLTVDLEAPQLSPPTGWKAASAADSIWPARPSNRNWPPACRPPNSACPASSA